jgi:lantibiotic modifying enzyme
MTAIEIAAQITDHLLSQVFRDGGRASWLRPSRPPGPGGRELVAATPLDGSLATGTAGVALFLAEYARQRDDEAAEDVAHEAIMHALDWADRSTASGLYDGVSGVAVAAARIAAVLDAPQIRARGEAAWARRQGVADGENDLYSGLAGQVLAALALDRQGTARDLCDELLLRAQTTEMGTAWATGRPEDRHTFLLGFAHGVSGIAYALATAGGELGRRDYLAAAAAGCRYERVYWDSHWNNWPDLRSSAPPLTSSARQFIWAWCHGAPGIAVSRLVLSPDHPECSAELHEAVESTIWMTDRQFLADDADLCLCHGALGNVEIALTCGLRADRTMWVEWAKDRIESLTESRLIEALEWSTGTGPSGDPSLIGGAAGIGLTALHCHDRSTASVLAVNPTFTHVGMTTATPRNRGLRPPTRVASVR